MKIILIISILATLEVLLIKAIVLSKLLPEEIIPVEEDERIR